MNLVMQSFGRIVKPLFGTGIGRIPGIVPTYKYLWRNFGPRGIIETEANGFKIKISSRDWAVAPSLVFGHVWEPQETSIVKEYVKPGMIALDIGAHVGYYSLLMAKLVGDAGTVLSFEPSIDTRILLASNLSVNDMRNVAIYPYAIGNANYKSFIYMDEVSPASNTLWPAGKEEGQSVEVKTLDSLVDSKVDFIKMDIEGNEYNALKGMLKIVRRSPDLVMLSEVYQAGLHATGASVIDYITLLQKFFKVYFLDGREANAFTVIRECKKAGSINILCKRSKYD